MALAPAVLGVVALFAGTLATIANPPNGPRDFLTPTRIVPR
jgi:hypothetical protein